MITPQSRLAPSQLPFRGAEIQKNKEESAECRLFFNVVCMILWLCAGEPYSGRTSELVRPWLNNDDNQNLKKWHKNEITSS